MWGHVCEWQRLQAHSHECALHLASSSARPKIPPLSEVLVCHGRPFIWQGEVYLGHWIGFLPAQERMALAKLDMEAGVVKYVHRFSHLSEEIEAAQHPDTTQDIQTGAPSMLSKMLTSDRKVYLPAHGSNMRRFGSPLWGC